MRTSKRKTRSDKFPSTYIPQDNTVKRSKEEFVTSGPTRSWPIAMCRIQFPHMIRAESKRGGESPPEACM